MARPVKATSKSKRKKSGPSQFERFVETAREVGADESGATFERAFEKLVPAKTRPRPGEKALRPPGRQG
jgi:hypothetical protein